MLFRKTRQRVAHSLPPRRQSAILLHNVATVAGATLMHRTAPSNKRVKYVLCPFFVKVADVPTELLIYFTCSFTLPSHCFLFSILLYCQILILSIYLPYYSISSDVWHIFIVNLGVYVYDCFVVSAMQVLVM